MVGPNGKVELVRLREALARAEERGLDLINITPNKRIPICKILDYGKFKYEQQKKEKLQKKNQTKIIRKEYRIGVLTSDYDLNYRKKQIIESLKKGYYVKVSLKLYGRFLGITDAGFDTLQKLADDLKEYADLAKGPIRGMNARYVDIFLVPNKAVLTKLKEVQRKKKEKTSKKLSQNNLKKSTEIKPDESTKSVTIDLSQKNEQKTI